jgi:hypothetical protein
MELFLAEESGFFDPKTFEFAGEDLWLSASKSPSPHALPALQKLHSLGCKASGTDRHGWNCLFLSIMKPHNPATSDDLEELQFLLGVFDNVYAQNAKGYTIFDLVSQFSFSSYQRDLLYCALERADIDLNDHLTHHRHPRIAVYETITNPCWYYTPEHYHALKHLQSWDQSNFRSQMDCLLQEIPLDEEESREMERFRVVELTNDYETEREAEEDSSEWETDEEADEESSDWDTDEETGDDEQDL